MNYMSGNWPVQRADRDPRSRRAGHQLAAQQTAVDGGVLLPRAGGQGRPALHAGGRQGTAEVRHPRRQPGDLHRVRDALRPSRARCRRIPNSTIPLGKAAVRREGTDVTVVADMRNDPAGGARSWPGPASTRSSIRTPTLLDGRSSSRYARPIAPWWWRRGPASPAWAPSSAAVITEQAFDDLDAPVERVTVLGPDAVRAHRRRRRRPRRSASSSRCAASATPTATGRAEMAVSKVLMPKLSEAMESGKIIKLAQEGRATASSPATSWPRSRNRQGRRRDGSVRQRRAAQKSYNRPAAPCPWARSSASSPSPTRTSPRWRARRAPPRRRRRRSCAGRSGPRGRGCNVEPSRRGPATAPPRGSRRAHAVTGERTDRADANGAGRRGSGDRHAPRRRREPGAR